ncbi:s-methyl-5-thioribose-1-phosphate isomerase [Brevibacillus sp. NRS-1366]|uniref:s-methyl-5-thioribose-1-phosphate isomerase n=1 Tax=Brevibacillus sp. NRS-1366 TaxID=3233899 RepID=UPI003D1AA9A8
MSQFNSLSRADTGLAEFLRYENVAWFEDGVVKILDRRVFPTETRYVTCKTVEEVKNAIKDMVTQSGGVKLAAFQALRLQAHLIGGAKDATAIASLRKAANIVANARPTTAPQMERMLGVIVDKIEECEDGVPLAVATDNAVLAAMNKRYEDFRVIAGHIVDALPNRPRILTHCFAELLLGFVLLLAKERGLSPELICTETRPYLQGARFTATVGMQTGVPVTLITDGMPGAMMTAGKIDAFITAADVITMDGFVANKVGTYQIATLAKRHGVPYYVGGFPSGAHSSGNDIVVEQRNPDEVLMVLGQRVALAGVNGYYPAFDVTPAELVTAISTVEGLKRPDELMIKKEAN